MGDSVTCGLLSTSCVGVDAAIERPDGQRICFSRETQTEPYLSPEEAALSRKLLFRYQEIGIYQKEMVKLSEQLKETRYREELAQGMRMGAENRLRDTEEELTKMRYGEAEIRQAHLAEVSRLEVELEAERKRGRIVDGERWRLTGRVEEIIRQLEDNHKCVM